jgi:glycolate oxidase FAD binding subunit
VSSPATVQPSCINNIVGAQNVITSLGELSAYCVDGIAPQIAARPANAAEVCELIKFAAAENLAIIPSGARTKLGIGMPPSRYDLAIDMARLDHLISYDPGDLTLSVEPGVPLVSLGEALAKHNQFLPLTVPFYNRATVGGTLASGMDSSLRQFYGTARDFVLGMEFVSGEGALTKSGGRVVKNVSGYDLHKLFLGSIGSLGIITRINFKTFPLPASECIFAALFNSIDEALALRQKISSSPISPSTLEILSPEMISLLLSGDAVSALGAARPSESEWLFAANFFGSPAVLERCSSELQRMAEQSGAKKAALISDPARQYIFSRLREAVPLILESAPAAIILKITALPSNLGEVLQFLDSESGRYNIRSAQLIRGAGIIYWFIFPDSPEAQKEKAAIRQEVLPAGERHGFQATVVACPWEFKRVLNVWGPTRDDFLLMQRLKRAFDPHNIFAPGRFVGGL